MLTFVWEEIQPIFVSIYCLKLGGLRAINLKSVISISASQPLLSINITRSFVNYPWIVSLGYELDLFNFRSITRVRTSA